MWAHEGVKYFRYPGLSVRPDLIHAVFTRCGGVSDPPFDGLNTSYGVGDLPYNVTENLGKIKNITGADRLVSMNQSHGSGIMVLGRGNSYAQGGTPQTDAMITDMPRIALMVKQADCQGVILFDPQKGALANVHCGWRGNVQNILGRVITRMSEEFGSEAGDLLVAIGPSLGPCCAEFVSYREIFPKGFERFMVRQDYFDLWAISCFQLVEAGVMEENIELAAICTRCKTDLFYSYRGEGLTGRFGTVAMLI